MKLSRIASIAVGSMAWLALAGTAVAQAVVMRGLDNPRGLAFAPNGALYVTEAGRGGSGPCLVNPGTGEARCFGKTGAITRLWKGQQSRVAEGLESHAVPDGSSASGPNDISFQGTGGAYITLGLGGDHEFQEALGGVNRGTLIHMAASGKWKVVADVAAHEIDENPAGGPVDSNPFGVLAEPGGRLVVDAGANALLQRRGQRQGRDGGRVSAAAQSHALRAAHDRGRPDCRGPRPRRRPVRRPADGIPVRAGTGEYLPGGPGTGPVVHCTGFKTIMDLTFGPDGSLYVVENATGGFPPFRSLRPQFGSAVACRSGLHHHDRCWKGSIARPRSRWAPMERSTSPITVSRPAPARS